jgi:lipopolysaccharide export system permease protein
LIIRRYIHFEILQNFLRVTGLLLLIYTSNKFVIILADAAVGKISSDYFLKLLGFKVISVLPIFLPFTLLIAVVLTYSRLINDEEMVVLLSSGVSKLQQLKIVFQFSLVICVFVAVIALYVAPWSEAKIIEINNIAKQESDINGIAAGQFKEFNEGNGIVYIESISKKGNAMNGVFMQSSQQGKSGVLISDSSYFKTDKKSGDRYIVFKNGRRYVGEAGDLDFQITNYETYAMLIETNAETSAVGSDLDAVPTAMLFLSNLATHKAELQWRFSSVFSCMLLALFAVIISIVSLGQKRNLLIFLSIFSYIIYSNLLSITKSLLEHDKIAPFPGIWSVHVLLLTIMLMLYYFPKIRQWKKSNRSVTILTSED